MARAIWKGAISFGLVHIPVSLSSAISSVRESSLDKRELEMARRLVEDMSGHWAPED